MGEFEWVLKDVVLSCLNILYFIRCSAKQFVCFSTQYVLWWTGSGAANMC